MVRVDTRRSDGLKEPEGSGMTTITATNPVMGVLARRRRRLFKDYPWILAVRQRWTGNEKVYFEKLNTWPGFEKYPARGQIFVHYFMEGVEATIPVPRQNCADLHLEVMEAIREQEPEKFVIGHFWLFCKNYAVVEGDVIYIFR